MKSSEGMPGPGSEFCFETSLSSFLDLGDISVETCSGVSSFLDLGEISVEMGSCMVSVGGGFRLMVWLVKDSDWRGIHGVATSSLSRRRNGV